MITRIFFSQDEDYQFEEEDSLPVSHASLIWPVRQSIAQTLVLPSTAL